MDAGPLSTSVTLMRKRKSPLGKSGVALVAGDAHPALGEHIARLVEATLLPVAVSAFADGETRVRIEADVQDADLYIVQPTSAPTNERLMTLALIADAARVAGAARVTAVVPYFGYARQDARKTTGEPRSAQLAARILLAAGIDRMVAVELHSPALENAFEIPLIHLQADELMLAAIREWGVRNLAVVSSRCRGIEARATLRPCPGGAAGSRCQGPPAVDIAVPLQVLGDRTGTGMPDRR